LLIIFITAVCAATVCAMALPSLCFVSRRKAIMEELFKGTHVIVDRYAHSGVCFTSGASLGCSAPCACAPLS
jgi:thymidylate kinase